MTKCSLATVRSCTAWRTLAVALLCAWVALAPGLAEARAGSSSSSSGSGSSMGSRGSRTFQDNGAAPVQRSLTPTPSPSQPSIAPRPAPFAPGFGGGFAQQHPFMSGLMGGFLGAGLAGMLFGHSAYAADGSGFAGMLGLLLQFAVIAGLIWLAVSFFRRRSGLVPTPAMFPGAVPRAVGAMAAPAAARDPVEIPIGEADFNAWSDLLVGIQSAWSKGDLGALRRYVTPEMLSYFSEELSRNVSQGVENRVEHVTLLKGDLQEAWSEGELEYATARLRWSAIDYMVALPQANGPQANGGGQEVIVRGDPSRATEATEVWTFVRSHGGRWLLSAIQQV